MQSVETVYLKKYYMVMDRPHGRNKVEMKTVGMIPYSEFNSKVEESHTRWK